MGQNLKKTGHVILTTPILELICHRKLGFDTVYLHAILDDSSFTVPEISLGASKFKAIHVTLSTPLLRVICILMHGLDKAYMHAQFDHCRPLHCPILIQF